MSMERWLDDTDRKPEVLEAKPIPQPLRPPQIPNGYMLFVQSMNMVKYKDKLREERAYAEHNLVY